MIFERKVNVVSNITQKATVFLSNELRNKNRVESKLLSNSLRIKKKIVEERNRTLIALYRSNIKQKRDRGGVGTLGLLGGGGLLGRGLRGFRSSRVPSTPSQLLRMQKGTSSLSRVGKFGKLGKVGPLALLGTGLDFAGRKAEGQTNLQAGLGAGGGLAGALAGGKAGALIGTAIGGPIGTVVGGIGGSIIGGLAGGSIADMFSGADRRRKIEIQKSLAGEKSLFSFALDDLDRVLDKLALRKLDIDSFIMKRGDDDRSLFEKIFLPGKKPPKDLLGEEIKQKSNARMIGEEFAKYAAIAGTVILLVPTDFSDIWTTAPLSAKLYSLVKSTRSFRLLQASKFVKPGTQTMSKSAAEKVLSNLGITIKKKLKNLPKITRSRRIQKNRPNLQNQDRVTYQDTLQEFPYKKLKPNEVERQLNLIDKILKKNKVRNPIKKRQLNLFKQKNKPQDVSSSDIGGDTPTVSLDNENNNNIALAPTNNIFLVPPASKNQQQSPPTIQGGDIIISGSSSNTFDNVAKYAEITALMTV